MLSLPEVTSTKVKFTLNLINRSINTHLIIVLGWSVWSLQRWRHCGSYGGIPRLTNKTLEIKN